MALNATHFLKLYQESSSKLLNLLEQPFEIPRTVEFVPPSKVFILTSIQNDCLRDLHDCLHEGDYQKSLTLLWFAKRHFQCLSESISYFESIFAAHLSNRITCCDTNAQDLFIAMSLPKAPICNFEQLSLNDAVDKLYALSSLKIDNDSLLHFKSTFNTCLISVEFNDSEFLTAELETFVRELSFDMDWFKRIRDSLIGHIIEQLKAVHLIDECLVSRLLMIEPTLSDTIESLLKAQQQQQIEESLAAFKKALPSLLDKIFKDLLVLLKKKPSSISWLPVECAELNGIQNHLSSISAPSSDCLDSVLPSFESLTKSKVNIITTMFRNQRKDSLDSALAVNFYPLVNYSTILASSTPLDRFINAHISEPILDEWYDAVTDLFHNSEAKFGHEFSVCYLANLFISANVSESHRRELLDRLGIRNVEENLLHIGIRQLDQPIPVSLPSSQTTSARGPVAHFK